MLFRSQGHLEELFLKALADNGFKYDFKQYSKDNINLVHSEKGLKIFYPNIPQTNFSKIPGSPIAYWASDRVIEIFESFDSIIDYAVPRQGMATANNDRFLKLWNEVDLKKIGFDKISQIVALQSQKKWFPYNKGGGFKKWYGNNEYVVNWREKVFASRML